MTVVFVLTVVVMMINIVVVVAIVVIMMAVTNDAIMNPAAQKITHRLSDLTQKKPADFLLGLIDFAVLRAALLVEINLFLLDVRRKQANGLKDLRAKAPAVNNRATDRRSHPRMVRVDLIVLITGIGRNGTGDFAHDYTWMAITERGGKQVVGRDVLMALRKPGATATTNTAGATILLVITDQQNLALMVTDSSRTVEQLEGRLAVAIQGNGERGAAR